MELRPVDCGKFFCWQFNKLATTSTAGQATGVLKRFVVQRCKITTWQKKREKTTWQKKEKEKEKKKGKTPGRKKTNHLAEVALKEKSNPCATHCDHKDERALKYHIAILRISYYPLKSNHIH